MQSIPKSQRRTLFINKLSSLTNYKHKIFPAIPSSKNLNNSKTHESPVKKTQSRNLIKDPLRHSPLSFSGTRLPSIRRMSGEARDEGHALPASPLALRGGEGALLREDGGAFLRWSPQKGFSSDGERSDIYLGAEKEVSCLILEYFLRVCYLEGVGMRLSFFGEFYLKVRFTLF